MKCSMGVAPAALIVVPVPPPVTAENKPMASVMDFKPMVNIPTFGMCNAKPNPAVIATTAAALGVHTPAPCIPATTSPWAPGSATVKVGQFPALRATDKCMCTWTGQIEITNPGTTIITTA